jgi:hypothetical protein
MILYDGHPNTQAIKNRPIESMQQYGSPNTKKAWQEGEEVRQANNQNKH